LPFEGENVPHVKRRFSPTLEGKDTMSEHLLRTMGNGFIGFIAYQIIKDFVYPWFIEFRREPAKLKSTYVGTVIWEDGSSCEISVQLRKLGYTVSGSMALVEGKGETEYKLNGRYSGGLLTFTYRPKYSASASEGCGTFQRLRDGELLSGYLAYLSQSSNQVQTVHCDLNAA
jgi:hypothetical protein